MITGVSCVLILHSHPMVFELQTAQVTHVQNRIAHYLHLTHVKMNTLDFTLLTILFVPLKHSMTQPIFKLKIKKI